MARSGWSGYTVAKARAWLAAQTDWPTSCARCGRTLHEHDAWVVGHTVGRDQAPDLTHDQDNWRVECRACSDSSGGKYAAAKRRTRPRARSLATPSQPHRPSLDLSPRAVDAPQTQPEWVPDVPIPPRLVTPVPADAVGSYGGEFVSWCHEHWDEEPLPWQAYCAARLLEHDADGHLLHRRVGISVCRQVGKSTFLRMLAAWRLHQADRFGEAQTVLHVAHALTTVEEVFWPAVEWAKRRGHDTREANGQMRVQVDESRWLPRSTQTGYGFTLSAALVDEAWAVAERRVNSTYNPALSARAGGQIVMFSSANEEATPLFPKFRSTNRPGWLLLEWSAPPDADPYDHEVWQAASPVPLDRTRLELMADELAADERTFTFERLNRWPRQAGMTWGQRLAGLVRDAEQELPPPAPGGAAALEVALDGQTWAAAAGDGQGVSVVGGLRLSEALERLRGWQPGLLLVHEAVAKQLPDEVWQVQRVTVQDTTAATGTLERVLSDGSVAVSSSGLLQVQTAGAGTVPAQGGRRLSEKASAGPIEALKAVSWVLWHATTNVAPAAMVY